MKENIWGYDMNHWLYEGKLVYYSTERDAWNKNINISIIITDEREITREFWNFWMHYFEMYVRLWNFVPNDNKTKEEGIRRSQNITLRDIKTSN